MDGNDWQQGNDVYRSDHPVMQFVARQQRLLNQNPQMTKQEAFRRVEDEFRERRLKQEKHQKMLMAMACGRGEVKPLFSSGSDVRAMKTAEHEAIHMRHIRKQLRRIRMKKEEDLELEARREAGEEEVEGAEDRGRAAEKDKLVRGKDVGTLFVKNCFFGRLVVFGKERSFGFVKSIGWIFEIHYRL